MEIWRIVEGFEDYQISNLGRVKSLSRLILRNGKYPFISKEKILKPRVGKNGYKQLILVKDGKNYTKRIHQLVAIAFLDHKPCKFKMVVNHIDFNKLNNNVDNLEIVTNRENSYHKHLPCTSKYIGVSWNKGEKKWYSNIFVDGKPKQLGKFVNEIDASNAYQEELNRILTEDKLKEYE